MRGRDVTIGGVSLAIRDLDRSSPARDTVRALEAAPGEHDLRILLSHAPDAVYALDADSRVDLVVAGHTHGGQIALPVIGPLLTLSRVPRFAAAGGLHQVESDGARHWLYVTRGIGMERLQAPRVRFRIAPEELLGVYREADRSVLEVVGYYHSHPDHPARPSETDRQRAAESISDGVIHLVVGVTGGAGTTPTAWVFRDAGRAFEPEPLEVVD